MADNKTKVAQERPGIDFFEPLWPIVFFQKITDRALNGSEAPRREHTARTRRPARARTRRPARKKNRHRRAA